MKRYLIALLMCAAVPAFANSACDQPKQEFDSLYCLNKVYHEADKELNTNFKKLNASLNVEGKKRLKAGQLAWIAERNKSCSRSEVDAFFVNLDCAASTTIQRSRFLQDRIRECTSAGCQNGKL